MDSKRFIEAAKKFSKPDEIFQTLENRKKAFVKRFPLDKLLDIPVEGYSLLKAKYPDVFNDTFTYWLEHKNVAGDIGGGNASKFYIYMNNTGRYCIGCGNKKRYVEGAELKCEYNELISKIVKAIELAKVDNIEGIKELNIPLWNMVLLKILSIYVPDKFIDVYSSSVLVKLAEILNLYVDKSSQNSIEINYLVTKKLREMNEFKQWKMVKLSNFVWETLGNNKGV